MKKKIIAFVISSVLSIAMLSACDTSSGNTAASNGTTGASSEAAAAQSSTASEPVKINMVYLNYGITPPDLQLIADTFNEQYGVPLINAEIHLNPINIGNYIEQVNLLLQSGSDIDIMMMFGFDLTGMVNQGQLQPMDEYLDTYGQNIKSLVDPKWWDGCSVAGNIYAIPLPSRTYGVNNVLTCRDDICEKYGITATHLDTMDEVTAIFKTIKENDPELLPLALSTDGAVWPMPTDPGGRVFSNIGYNTAGVIPEDIDTLTVENYYASPEYKKKVETIRDWYLSGYIDPNASITTSEEVNALWDAGKVFGKMEIWTSGYNTGDNTTFPTRHITLGEQGEPRVGTGEISIFSWMLTASNKHPQESMQLLDLIFGNQEAAELLRWGIEGKHYVKTGKDDREIGYPEGVTAQDVSYANPLNYAFGDFYGGYYFMGSNPDAKKAAEEYNASKTPSRFLGFAFDQSAVKTEMAILDSIVSEYRAPLETGSVEPEKSLKALNESLMASGLDKVMAEYQKQIEAWAAANG